MIFNSNTSNMKRLALVGVLLCTALWVSAQQATVGKIVANVKVLNTSDKIASIPSLGEKVIVLFYTDPDVKDVNDPLSDAIKARKFSTDKYRGIGVANCKVTWIPNGAIRMKSRQKEKQFPGSVVLLDEDEKIRNSWSLADCDGKGVVIVVGKDSKIKLLSYVKSQAESKALIAQVTRVIQDEIAK